MPLSGGSINTAAKLETSAGHFFVKWNDAKKHPGMFEAEAKGLKLLKDANEIGVPEIIFYGEVEKTSFLLLEFIDPSSREKHFFHDFGKSLARLHKQSDEHFGLDHDNYIGSLKQGNKKHKQWSDFFREERLEKQLRMAFDEGKLRKSIIQQFDNLFNLLPEIFPGEKPSLLHGDLWSGNYSNDYLGKAAIFDPAVYYGSREMDIAMSKLFGGFDKEFYEGYNEEFPLENAWKERVDICNLYPLLVHVNLFGGSYGRDVERILSKF